jgi:drug/metabolite transporter (DMT)-like permease
MQPGSLGLLIGAAFLHAAVNALMKRARDKLAFTWWVLGASWVLGAPLLLVGGPRDGTGWLLVGVSGLLEAVYFVALSRAYSLGDLSVVYPIARGSAPLFIVAWSGLFLHERPTPGGLGGILTIVLGIYLINLPSISDWSRPLSGFKEPATRWALLTGVLISGYATVDKAGVDHVEPAAYVVLILAVGWLLLTAQWLFPGRRRALLTEIGAGKEAIPGRPRLRIVLGAVFGTAAYLLVLVALRSSPVSYVGSVREVSFVIGAWMGVYFFGERSGPVRVVASVLIAFGILLIKLAG